MASPHCPVLQLGLLLCPLGLLFQLDFGQRRLIRGKKGTGQTGRSALKNKWRGASWREGGKGACPGTRDGWVWWCWVMAWLTWQRCMSACYVTICRVFFLASGGVIAYISSSSSASSPAPCHSESSDSGFQSSSSPVPSSPNSSSSESGCNGRGSEGSDGAPKSDRLEETIKTNQSSVAGLTKGHNGVTSMFGASSCNHHFPPVYYNPVCYNQVLCVVCCEGISVIFHKHGTIKDSPLKCIQLSSSSYLLCPVLVTGGDQ